MTSFALVAEGITDQVVLERIIGTVFESRGDEDVEVVFLQPIRDATDESRQGDFGGWERVLEFCSSTDRLQEALAFNDYLVVHIDTDCCEHPNYGVPRTHNGETRTHNDLVEDVRRVIEARLGQQFCERWRERLVFAIAVHNIEFWILPFYSSESVSAGAICCEKRLRRALFGQRIGYSKDYRGYVLLSRCFSRFADVQRGKSQSYSLELFVNSLLALEVM